MRRALFFPLFSVTFCVALVLATPASHAATTAYILTEGKILQLDIDAELKRARAAAASTSDTAAEGKKKKKKVKPKDTATLLSEGWKGALDIETDGTFVYVLLKDSVVRVPVKQPTQRETVAAGLEQAQQIVVDRGYLYIRTVGSVTRTPVDGKGKSETLTNGFGGMRDMAVSKNMLVVRMGDGRFFKLSGKKWKDKLVSQGWRGILRMRNIGSRMFLFSGGQVFTFKPGRRGSIFMDELSAAYEGFWAHKKYLLFSSRMGQVFVAKAKKGAKHIEIRPKVSLIDDIAIH